MIYSTSVLLSFICGEATSNIVIIMIYYIFWQVYMPAIIPTVNIYRCRLIDEMSNRPNDLIMCILALASLGELNS